MKRAKIFKRLKKDIKKGGKGVKEAYTEMILSSAQLLKIEGWLLFPPNTSETDLAQYLHGKGWETSAPTNKPQPTEQPI